MAVDAGGNLWVTHQDVEVEEFAAAEVVSTGTPSATSTLTGISNPQESAIEPPPYDLPLSHTVGRRHLSEELSDGADRLQRHRAGDR